MNKEQRQRMAYREFAVIDPDDGEASNILIQVSGNRAELHRQWEQPWDNESGTGPDIARDTWAMSIGDLKQFIADAQWCLEKSEAFEKSHPKE